MADTEEFPRQTVLVLGATGFVGARLVEMLAASADFRPIAASRHIADRLSLAGVETRRCDATDPDDMREALAGVDLVVNCIAGSPKSMAAATETLCVVARRLPPRRIVHLSSMAVYGGATGIVDETTEPVPPVTGYAWGKRASERMVREYVRDGGDAVILRPGCIHGPGSTQWTARIASLLQNQRIGDLGAAGDGYSNLVYIDDLVSAIMTALVRPNISGGIFNIAGTDPTTWNEFFLRFGRALGATPVPRLSSRRLALESRVVAPALRMAGLAARAIRLPRALMPEAITPSLVRLWRQDIQLDVSHANSRLDLPHTPLDRALTASVHWLATRPALSMHAVRPMGARDTGARDTGARHI
jgi:2-alkyl-3-oxoalkanoate reductase